MRSLDRFARTACACRECVDCCTQQPGSLAPGDFERIAAHLGEGREAAKLHFWASPGAVVGQFVGGALLTRRIGTITPRMAGGRCVFLDGADRCRVWPVAPFGCAMFDTHMAAADWRPRSEALVRAQDASAEYRSLRAELPPAGSWRPRGGIDVDALL